MDEVLFSLDCRRLAGARQYPLPGTEFWTNEVRASTAGGSSRNELIPGKPLGWIDAAHLLVTRAGSAQSQRGRALFRANPNACSATGQAALMFTAHFGNLKSAQPLLVESANPTLKDKGGATALSIAHEGHEKELVQLLEHASPPQSHQD